jgi:class 3 adenylate cyclase
MPRIQYRSMDQASDVRTFPKGRAEVVTVDTSTIGRVTYEPGWRWSTDLAPIMGTETCQLHHVGYAVSGVMHVHMDDGISTEIPPGSVFEIPAGHDAWVVGDEPWVAIAWNSLRTYALAPDRSTERVLGTVLFTDIVESTATLERIGDAAWLDLLSDHFDRLREELNVFRGREIATTGDGFLAVFDSASRAVHAAAAMSASAREMGLPIRVGAHTGEVELVGDNVQGVTVHTAQRVMSLAGADEVLVSSTTAELLRGSGLTLQDAGTHTLKGLDGLHHVFRLASPDVRRPFAAAEPGQTPEGVQVG